MSGALGESASVDRKSTGAASSAAIEGAHNNGAV